MKNIKYESCYCSFDEDVLIIGNELVERKLVFFNKLPVTEYILNKSTGHKWKSEKNRTILLNSLLNIKETTLDYNQYISDNDGLSNKHLSVELLLLDKNITVKLCFTIFPGIPFTTLNTYIKGSPLSKKLCEATITSGHYNGIENNYSISENQSLLNPKTDCIDAFGLSSQHLKVEVIKLIDQTDGNDYLLDESIVPLYPTKEKGLEGNMFIIDDYVNNESIMVVKEAPTAASELNRVSPDLFIKPGAYVQLIGSGINYDKISSEYYTPFYGSSIGVGTKEELKSFYKKLYRSMYLGDISENLFIMSNNWGDRNQDAAVCHDFVLKEIEAAYKLGIDIVQIDDGWQKGVTANSKLAKGGVWEGYYAYDNNFWDVNKVKFPQGLKPIVDCAEKYDLQIALWFSPDSSNDFVNWEMDAEVLLYYYREYKICYFKLDGIKIRSKLCEVNLINLLSKVSKESNNRVSFNMDITAESRFGYLYQKQFGTLFVENRYTDWANYYPHNTLKNLWCLSKVIPTNKLLFEILNNKRNIDKYKDLLAPINYSMDYIFAATMVANPLIWMEMSNLNESDMQSLTDIIKVYRLYRKDIFNSEVIPIGDMPDGCSFTGFQIRLTDKSGYLLLFRERCKQVTYAYKLKGLYDTTLKYEYIYSNRGVTNLLFNDKINSKGEVSVNINEELSFVFIKYNQANE
jgi:alpha-galactosidase